MNTTVDKTLFEKFFNNKWLRGFVLVAAVVLIISAILRALTVPAPPVATVITNELNTEVKISFSDSLSLQMPEKLSTYSSTEVIDIEKYRDDLAKSLDLIPYPLLKNVWQDKNQVYQLMTEGDGLYLAYKKDVYFADPQPQVKLPLNPTQLQATTKTFIDSHQLFQNYALSGVQPFLLSAEGLITAPSEAEANVFEFEVNTLIDNIPFIVGDKGMPPGRVRVNANGDINRFNFYPVPQQFLKIETYSPLSLDAIKGKVDDGLLTIINIETNEDDISARGIITEATFHSATLEYRQNTQNGYILPYVRLSGIGKDKENKEYIVEAISPAIKVE